MEFLSKSRIKYIQSLQHRKFRLKYDKFTVEGLKISQELIRDKPHLIDELFVSHPGHAEILLASAGKVRVIQVTEHDMHQISQMTTPPGVLALCHMPPPLAVPESLSGLRAFYLEGIRDPGNLGTILRIADWFGLDLILLSPDCVDLYNPKVLQSAMGSAFRLPVAEMTPEQLLAHPEARRYVCDGSGDSIASIDAPADGVLILGNESQGVSDQLMQEVSDIIAIPRDRSRGAESLNVSVAAAVLAAWWTKSV